MKKIALLLTLSAFLGPMAPGAAAGDRAALPLTEVPAKSDKDKEKKVKKEQPAKEVLAYPPAPKISLKPCCAQPSRFTAMGAKPSAPAKK